LKIVSKYGNPYKKDDAQQQNLMEDLLLFVAKALHAYFCCQKLVAEALGMC
jgi:hypothetical protein